MEHGKKKHHNDADISLTSTIITTDEQGTFTYRPRGKKAPMNASQVSKKGQEITQTKPPKDEKQA